MSLLGGLADLRALLGNLGPLGLLPEGHRVLFPLPLSVHNHRPHKGPGSSIPAYIS